MAIVQTTEVYDGQTFLYTKSDSGYKIRQTETGRVYTDALDIADAEFTYTETDDPIDPDQAVPEENVYEEAGKILLGEMI